MNRLNRDNFLVWDHQFTPAPVVAIATDDIESMPVNGTVKFIDPWLNDTSSHGFNYASLEITVQDNPLKPSTYDPLTHYIAYYPPAGILPLTTRTIKYKWKDQAGNSSNEASISINIADRPTEWRGYAPSYHCLLDVSGDNTGYAEFAELEKYYVDDNTPYVPATTKPNDSGDPDYEPFVLDPITCPLPASSSSIYLYNNVPSLVLKSIKFGSAGSIQILNFSDTDTQPLQLAVTPGSYDEIVVVVNDSEVGVPKTVTLVPTSGVGGGAQATAGGGGVNESITFLGVDITGANAGDLSINP